MLHSEDAGLMHQAQHCKSYMSMGRICIQQTFKMATSSHLVVLLTFLKLLCMSAAATSSSPSVQQPLNDVLVKFHHIGFSINPEPSGIVKHEAEPYNSTR